MLTIHPVIQALHTSSTLYMLHKSVLGQYVINLSQGVHLSSFLYLTL
jgi:hypothetical protein